MQIQVNTDHNVVGHEARVIKFSKLVETALSKVKEHITRVEVHVTDENSHKGGLSDKRCVMEARLEGRQPVAVSHEAASPEQAVRGAADKLARTIGSTLGRQRDKSRRASAPKSSGAGPQDE